MTAWLATALSLPLLIGSASPLIAGDPTSNAPAEAEVKAAVADLADAFSKGDPERAAAHASLDLLLVHPLRGDVNYVGFVGSLRRNLRPYDGYKLTQANLDSVYVSGPIAVVSITWHTVTRDRAGKEATRGERDQEVWRREADGRWRLFRGASFPLPAPGYRTGR